MVGMLMNMYTCCLLQAVADAGYATSHMNLSTATGCSIRLWCHLHVYQFFAAGHEIGDATYHVYLWLAACYSP